MGTLLPRNAYYIVQGSHPHEANVVKLNIGVGDPRDVVYVDGVSRPQEIFQWHPTPTLSNVVLVAAGWPDGRCYSLLPSLVK